MNAVVVWKDIVAECGGYREGFVAVFRKYEGQPTDEKDAQNHVVKVTAASFARHMGIPTNTFRTWVKKSVNAAAGVTERERGDREERGARAVLRDAPLEQVEQIISTLPAERQRAIGAAAGHAYLGARQEHEEREGRLTPAQRKEREAQKREGREAMAKAMGGWNVASIVNSIDHATVLLQEMVEDHAVTENAITHIEKATDGLLAELRVARAMAGLDPDREESEV